MPEVINDMVSYWFMNELMYFLFCCCIPISVFCIMMTEKISGRRGRRRPRNIMLDGLQQLHEGMPSAEFLNNTRDKDLLRDMNIYTIWQDTR